MNHVDTFAFVIGVLAEFTDRQALAGTDHLVRDLALDSLDVLDAIQQVEDELDILVPTDILPRLQTVDDLVAELERRLAARG